MVSRRSSISTRLFCCSTACPSVHWCQSEKPPADILVLAHLNKQGFDSGYRNDNLSWDQELVHWWEKWAKGTNSSTTPSLLRKTTWLLPVNVDILWSFLNPYAYMHWNCIHNRGSPCGMITSCSISTNSTSNSSANRSTCKQVVLSFCLWEALVEFNLWKKGDLVNISFWAGKWLQIGQSSFSSWAGVNQYILIKQVSIISTHWKNV